MSNKGLVDCRICTACSKRCHALWIVSALSSRNARPGVLLDKIESFGDLPGSDSSGKMKSHDPSRFVGDGRGRNRLGVTHEIMLVVVLMGGGVGQLAP